MAIVKFGPTVIGIRGTIGGMTFSGNKSGSFIKAWRKPVTQKSGIAQKLKSDMSRYGPIWSSLDPSLQAAWNALAASPPELDFNSLGIQYWLNGFQWFVRINQRRASQGLAVTTAVPTSPALSGLPSFSITASSGDPAAIALTWPSGYFPSGHYPYIFFTAYGTTGLTKEPHGFILIWSLIERPDTGIDISNFVAARFGNVPAGFTVFCRVHRITYDQILSVPATANVRVS